MPAATKFYISRCTSSSLYEILKYWMPQLYCIWCVIACWRCIPVKFQPLHDLSLTSWCLDQNSSNFPYICFILCDFVSATRMYSAKLGEILSDVTFLAFVIKFWKFVDVISKVCKWHKQWGYFSLVDYYAGGELWWQLLRNLVPSCISDVASLMSFMPRFRVILESFNLCDAPLYEGKSCLMEFPWHKLTAKRSRFTFMRRVWASGSLRLI